jgi:hypothetical protein
MLPNFLIPETTASENGFGPEIEIPGGGRLLLATLGINRIVEQESLDIAIWGSPDKVDWGTKPIARFPQKFYCGTYSVVIDLMAHPEVNYLRAEFKMNRWGRGDQTPLFGFYVGIEAPVSKGINKRAVA